MVDDVQYYAHYGNPLEDEPWALLKTVGANAFRYIPHRNDYVQMRNLWDLVSGFSSESMGARRISPEEAKALESQVADLPEANVKYLGG